MPSSDSKQGSKSISSGEHRRKTKKKMKNELSQEQSRDVITDLALSASWYALTHGLKFFENSFVNINEQGLFWFGLENQSSVGRTVDYMHPDLQREHVTGDLAVWSYENGRFRFASLAGG